MLIGCDVWTRVCVCLLQDHLTRFPDNLLMKLLGLYRLKLGGDKWEIVVIQNVFEASSGIHERFDLKGKHRLQPTLNSFVR
jgi:hypothetical protein